MNMKLLKHLGVMAAVLVGAGFESVQAQEGIVIPISDGGTITVDCDAAETIYFTDDNSGGTDFQDPYSNQNYTITLCPSEPGDAVQVNFLSFDLQTNANPNNNDVLLASTVTTRVRIWWVREQATRLWGSASLHPLTTRRGV